MPAEASPLFAIITVQLVWLSSVTASYASDARAQKLLQQLALDPASSDTFTLNQGILRYKGRIWVGNDNKL
jgi:hypothetical protein